MEDKIFNEAMVWAFGSGWNAVPLSSLPDIFNSRHGDIFEIDGSDSVYETNRKIADYYVENVMGKA